MQREGGKPSIEAREVERRPQEAQGGHGEYNTITLPPAPCPTQKSTSKSYLLQALALI